MFIKRMLFVLVVLITITQGAVSAQSRSISKNVEEKPIPKTTAQVKSALLNLNEVQVVAYGTQEKKAITGSQVRVGSEQIQFRQVSDVSRLLEGLVSGVQISTVSGQPGSGANVRIRGMGSLSAINTPLYVVDGMPMEGGLNHLSSYDIESITVLKDASSTALYGARAANGVILLTTKKGMEGKARITFNGQFGVNSKAYKGYDAMTNPAEYYETYWEALRNNLMYQQGYTLMQANTNASERMIKWTNPQSGAVEWKLGYNAYNVADNALIDPRTGRLNANADLLYHDDWAKEAFKQSTRQDYALTISGMEHETNYFLSFNSLEDAGFAPNSGFNRYAARVKLSKQMNPYLQVGVNAQYNQTKTKNPTSTTSSSNNLFYVANVMAPIYPVYQRDVQGGYVLDAYGKKQYDFGTSQTQKRPVMMLSNPIGTQRLDRYETIEDQFNGLAKAILTLSPALSLHTQVGVDQSFANGLKVNNNQIGQYAATGGSVRRSLDQSSALNANQILNYQRVLYPKNRLSVKLGHEWYQSKESNLYGAKQQFLFPIISELNGAIRTTEVGSSSSDYALESFFSQLHLNHDNRYYLEGSLRTDGSSRFHPNNRWGVFWSLGGAWLLKEEAFLQQVEAIDYLKVRLSYGSVGNDRLGGGFYNKAYEDQYVAVNSNDQISMQLAYKGNPDLTWESNQSLSVGLDYCFLNRISGSLDYFKRNTKDLLFLMDQAPSIGYAVKPENAGTLSNEGMELDVLVHVLESNDLNVQVGFQATGYRSKIVALPQKYKANGTVRGSFQKWQEGSSPYQFYIREFAGVDPLTGQGTWYQDVTDLNGVVTKQTTSDWSSATRYVLDKESTPDLFGGFSVSAQYKGFDFSLQTAYQCGGWTYDGIYASMMHGGDDAHLGYNWHRDILKRWTSTNTQTDVPRLEGYADYNNVDDRWLTRSDYMAVKNITFGYQLPKSLLSACQIESLRVYASAENPWFMSRRQGMDPRLYFDGIQTSEDINYAPMKTFSFGVNVTF